MEDTKYNDTEKKCCKCLKFKPFCDFNKCKRASLGLHNHCRLCQKETKLNWRLNNKEKETEYAKIYSKTDKVKKQRKQRWLEKKDILGPAQNLRRRQEAAKVKARIQRAKWYSIPHNHIAQSLRSRIRHALNGVARAKKTEYLVGCSFEDLKVYIESKFQLGMNWDNYGEWHIDHIKPCSAFDLTQIEQQLECFHYSNLQPLWAFDNISKGGINRM